MMNSRIGQLLLLVLVCGMCAGACRAQTALSYEPAVVKLTGKISKVTLPGEPNFESIKKGDRPEVCYFLTLAKPVAVKGSPKDEINVTENRVSDFQLAATKETVARFKQLEQLAKRHARATLSGTLFHAHTGHHHTAVLMDVSAIKEEGRMRSSALKR